MFKVAIDITNQTFGRLTVKRRLEKGKWGQWLWECECECGNMCISTAANLRSGKQRSCGCLKREGMSARRGENHPRWKGGRYVDKNGYVTIRCYDYPGDEGKAVSVFEHQAVMAKHLGRPIYNDESIHHKNGQRDDNRIENLELKVSHHGQGQTIEDAVVWAREILSRYGSIS